MLGFLFGYRITSATIVPGKDYDGMVRQRPRGRMDLDDVATPQMRHKIERNIIVLLAGDIAQRKFAPRSARRWHTTADRRAAATLALSICGSGKSATAYIAWLHIVTSDLVEARWKVIQRLATELLERKTLTGDEIRDCIFSRNGKPSFSLRPA